MKYLMDTDERREQMSGGSLNYLANTMCETLFNDETDLNCGAICDRGNARIARNLNPMHDRELSELIADVTCLLHDLEWYESCDISEDKYKESVNKFKKKWVLKSPEARTNSYAEDLKALYEELDAEMRGE